MARAATEVRKRARVKARAERRAATYSNELQSAETAKGRFTAACRFLVAVVDDLSERRIDEVTRQVLKVANEGNQP